MRNIGIALILLLFALGAFVVKPIYDEFSYCFLISTGELKQAAKPPQVDKETACKIDQEILLSLYDCIQKVKNKSVFAPILFRLATFLFSSKFESAANTFNIHNQICPGYSVPQLFTK